MFSVRDRPLSLLIMDIFHRNSVVDSDFLYSMYGLYIQCVIEKEDDYYDGKMTTML